jgi:type 1 fimbriae regulatory protein FimB/type 1 fimbriae regulatory protein FimE
VENQHVNNRASSVENVTVGGRMREYLTEKEVDRLIEAAKGNRWGHRDATAILIAYRHGLRASELVALRWSDIELQTGRMHVRRAKGGNASVHPISARESRVLRRLHRECPSSPYLFVSERGAPLSVAGYQRMVARAGEAARFGFLIHSHMLRHGCGFKLAADGQDTRAPSRPTSAIGQSSPQCATRPWLQIGSRTSGRTSAVVSATWEAGGSASITHVICSALI